MPQGFHRLDGGGEVLSQIGSLFLVAAADSLGSVRMPAAFQGKGMGQGGVEIEESGVFRIFLGIPGVFMHQGRVMLHSLEALRVLFENLHQRILVQVNLAGVGGVVGIAGHAGDAVQLRQGKEGFRIGMAAAAEPGMQIFLVVFRLVGHFRIELQGQQRGQQVALLAIIAPGGAQNQGNSGLFAGGQGGNGIGNGGGIGGRGADPGPQAAGEHRLCREHGMLAQGIGVHFFLGLIVVPVDQADPGVHGGNGGGRGILLTVVVHAVDLEVHVAPDHGFQTHGFADVQHPLQVAAHDVLGIFVAMVVQMGAQAHAVGFVHAQVYLFGAVGGAGSPDHLLQNDVGLLTVRLDDGLILPDVVVGRPAHDPVQMAQGLDAGTQLDAEKRGVIIQRLQFVIGVAAPLVAEVGLLRDLIGIFRVHHAQIQAHQRHFPQEHPKGLRLQNGIAGAVEHDAAGLEVGFLPDVAGGKGLGNQAQRPVKLDRLSPGEGDGGTVADHAQMVALHGGDGDSGIGKRKQKVIGKLGNSGPVVFRSLSGDGDFDVHEVSPYTIYNK